ncbi:MAG TPA: hypothetical protein VE863_00195 [Pyrinomonadaceae bacterium]|nr:hypothetical protein [Pyrinomonadaceae bacterium]
MDREDLETTIGGSLGLKGIAEFKSQVEGSTGRELRLEEVCEVEEEFNFKAPECGRFTVQLFQLCRLYKFGFQDERFLHKHRWSKTIKEWINRIHDASKQSENDPDCGCHLDPVTGIDGVLYLSLGSISMLAPLKKVRDGMIVPGLIDRVFQDLKQIWSTTITLDREQIPPHLLFLANEGASELHGRFLSCVEDSYLT